MPAAAAGDVGMPSVPGDDGSTTPGVAAYGALADTAAKASFECECLPILFDCFPARNVCHVRGGVGLPLWARVCVGSWIL